MPTSMLRAAIPQVLAVVAALALLSPAPALAEAVTFTAEAPGAGSVYLAGEFNGWDPTAQAMTDGVFEDGDGAYKFETATDESTSTPGHVVYAYKFVEARRQRLEWP